MNTKPDSNVSRNNESYDCTRDIYAAMAESTIYKNHVGDGKSYITEARNFVMDLYEIEIFVKAVLSTSNPAFLITRHNNGKVDVTPTTLGKMLGGKFQPLRNMPERKTIESEIRVYRLSPNVNLYFDTLPNQGFRFHDPYLPEPDGRLQAEHFNDSVDELRRNSKGKAYQDEQKGRRKQAADNHKSLRGYIQTLLDKDHYAQLAVVRIDLAYINAPQNLVSIDFASAHREKFIGNRYHNKIFENVVGYAWALQYLEGKGGYYHHFFLFLDCKTLPNIDWHEALSDYWSGITDGIGRCRNFAFGYPGVGIIKRGEAEVFIEHAASILSKKEMYFSLKYVNHGKRFRTYDKGKISPRVQRYGGHNQN